MPIPIVVALVVAALAVTVGATVAMASWGKVMHWVGTSFIPWLRENIPELAEPAVRAFQFLDEMAVAVRREAKAAWERLRKNLLQQVGVLEKDAAGTWVLRVTSYVRTKLEEHGSSGPVVKIVSTQEVPYDQLPAEVREEAMRRGTNKHTFDVTKIRDAEVNDLDMGGLA